MARESHITARSSPLLMSRAVCITHFPAIKKRCWAPYDNIIFQLLIYIPLSYLHFKLYTLLAQRRTNANISSEMKYSKYKSLSLTSKKEKVLISTVFLCVYVMGILRLLLTYFDDSFFVGKGVVSSSVVVPFCP